MEISEIKKIVALSEHKSRHTSNIISAASLFSGRFNIPLLFDHAANHGLPPGTPATTWVIFETKNGEKINVCFDMADWPDILSYEALDVAHIYVKRSYSSSALATIPEEIKKKIMPYGLYFAFSPGSFEHELKAHKAIFLSELSRPIGKPLQALISAVRSLLKLALLNEAPFLHYDRLVNIVGGENTVFYQTRVWDPANVYSEISKTTSEINETRIHLVSELKERLGDQYIGGIIDSDYARKVCPELITPNKVCVSGYLALLGQSKIVIADQGLHGSFGAKFAEYFAAGRCIVGDMPYYDLPDAPVNGIHYSVYTDVAHCVSICEELLSNVNRVDSYMREAKHYFESVSDPVLSLVAPVLKY